MSENDKKFKVCFLDVAAAAACAGVFILFLFRSDWFWVRERREYEIYLNKNQKAWKFVRVNDCVSTLATDYLHIFFFFHPLWQKRKKKTLIYFWNCRIKL